MGCGHWDCSTGYSCGCARFHTIVSYFNRVECCSASWLNSIAWSSMKRPEGRVEISVVFAVCRAPGDLSEHAFCPLHISIATLRGRPSFRPLPPRTRVGGRCRCLKACRGIKWGLGCPLKCSLPFFTCSVSVRNSFSRQLGSWSVEVIKFIEIQGLWDPKRTSNSAKKFWMRIIHNAQTAALFVWALSFCKVWIETALNLNVFRVYGVDQVFAADTEPLHTCDETSPIDTFAALLWFHPARTTYSTYRWVLEPSSRRSEL